MLIRYALNALGALLLCHAAAALPADGRGQHCSSDRDCMFSMKCAANKCVCQDGYHLYKDSCLGGIGSSCHYDEDCIVDAYCEHHQVCACMEGLVKNEDGSKCDGNVTTIGRILDSNCHENFQCEQFGRAFCETKTNMCQCRVDSHLRNERCWDSRKLGEACIVTDECYTPRFIENVECENTNHTCACRRGTNISGDSLYCEALIVTGLATTNLYSIVALVISYIFFRIIAS